MVELNELGCFEITRSTTCLSLLEVEREFLPSLDETDMDRLRQITNIVTDLIWITGACMLGEPDPNMTLSSGLSRALMLEHPSLNFFVIDAGSAIVSEPEWNLLCTAVKRVMACGDHHGDKEFIYMNGALYVSRFVPDDELNSTFNQCLSKHKETERVELGSIGTAQLASGRVGVTDTLHFQQRSEVATPVPVGFADIAVKAVCLNAKDIYTMSGRVETRTGTTAVEFSGIVTAVGPDITHIQPGDRVAVLYQNYFSTSERVPAWAAHKILPGEDPMVIPTLLTAYFTAIYALRFRANLRAGENVLIHAGSGALGLATISIAQRMGATVYTTVGSQDKKEFLIKQLGLPATHIFSSRDNSFVAGIQVATGEEGVDVVVNSLTGDLMHASWNCLANFGRFVEVGKRELSDAGRLQMHVFMRNATFTAFDITELFCHKDPFYHKFSSRYINPECMETLCMRSNA